jgi:demethylmenaquinone methyltransferase/2-methoxy-6-polyprenyl-1,4-benzoquinol methylase
VNDGSIHPAPKIRDFFSSIAGRYDLANHVLSGGCDFLWRRRAVSEITKTKPSRILDLATGSGDLALLLKKSCPASLVVGADFCFPMLQVARKKSVPALVAADAMRLPFAPQSFDAVTIAFGLRNMVSWKAALTEISRILAPGGTLLVLDFSLPQGVFGKLYHVYLHHVLPVVARVVTGNRSAYEYLGDSIEKFPQGREMLQVFTEAGYASARQLRLTGGIVTLYLGESARGEWRS